MYKSMFFLVLIFLVLGCKEDSFDPFVEDNTASGFMLCQINSSSWSANEVQEYKERDTLFLKGIVTLTSDSNYSSSEINFKIINLNQPGLYGIGEDELGFTYGVKGNYILKSAKNLPDVVYTAYYTEDNLMTITGINDRSIAAEFKMKVFSQSFSDSLLITNGRFSITY
ncbi:MAG: hypothetical protein MUO34_00410 [Ignavibacteriaceae bacterium]|nr:hypothetical protein [Ignavibacteriaceae bacterium]